MLMTENDPIRMRSPRGILLTVRALQRRMYRGPVSTWLSEEHYTVSKWCRCVEEGLSHVSCIAYVKTEGGWRPYAFSVSDTIAPDADEDAIVLALSHTRTDEAFLRTFPLLRVAAVLCSMEEAARTQEGIPKSLGPWMTVLRSMERLDMQRIHDRVSRVEAALCADPSGIYPHSSEDTKQSLRDAVMRGARYRRITEEAYAEGVLLAARTAAGQGDRDGMSITSRLLLPQIKERGGRIHLGMYGITLLLSLCVCLCLWGGGAVYAVTVSLLLLLPFYGLVRGLLVMLAGRYGSLPPLPALALETIPREGATLVVITALVTGGEGDEALCRNLERFFLRNREAHSHFALLCDLKEADTAVTAEDGPTVAALRARIRALCDTYGARFSLFVRDRVYVKGEGTYLGWERKRGAILELARFLRGEKTTLRTEAGGGIPFSDIRYVCTLDADTELPPGALRSMLSLMLHPMNRPLIREGRVTQGVGILQPAMATTLSAAVRSRFTLLCAGRGGVDPYSRFSVDGEQLLFGRGSFCGKGMFDVDAYLAVLDGLYPEEAVLSHDFLEGAVLRCVCDSRVVLSDGIPTTPSAYFARQSRWVRGDTQALRFAGPRHKDARGARRKNPISLGERLRIIDHFLDALLPVALIRAVLVISLLGHRAVLFLLLCAFSPRLLWAVAVLLRPASYRSLFRRFQGLVLTDLRQQLLWLWFRVRFAVQEAWVNLSAVTLALVRMLITHKHLLAWQTAASLEGGKEKGKEKGKETKKEKRRGDTPGKLLSAHMPSLLVGALLTLFSASVIPRLLGLCFFFTPLWAYYLGRRCRTRVPKRRISYADASRYAKDTFRFFDTFVGQRTCYLPPDNVQWFPRPTETVAPRTSPTNIGLYLLSLLAARDFGFLSCGEMTDRLLCTVDTLERMERYRGHFYNWYETEGATPIGDRYISTVDSGNLSCALMAVIGGCKEYEREDARLIPLQGRLRALALQTDYSFLYDKRREQLVLGYHTVTGTPSEGLYDHYASEVRSAYYFAIARGQIPKEAWEKLARPVTVEEGGLGILSWSGSVFEYSMPGLWLTVPENSLSREMLSYAYEAQKRAWVWAEGYGRLFGRSEGGYFAFDPMYTFRYQPCGIPTLGFSPEIVGQVLVMPYALFLLAQDAWDDTPVKEALDTLERMGMLGEYGFYEALDLTPDRCGGGWAVVRSVMAHHAGMSLVALDNMANDCIMRRRFAASAEMESHEILLWERIPTDAPVTRRLPLTPADTRGEKRRQATELPPVPSDALTDGYRELLSNTRMRLLADALGNLQFYDGDTALTVPYVTGAASIAAVPPIFLLRDGDGHVYTPCRLCGNGGDTRYDFVRDMGGITYSGHHGDGTTATLRLTVSATDATFSMTLSLTRRGEAIPFMLTFLARPVLYDAYAYAVHPTFADLFLETEIGDTFLCVTRKPRGREEGERRLYLHAGGLSNMRRCWDMRAILPMGYTAEDIRALACGTEVSQSGHGTATVPVMFLQGACGGTCTVKLSMEAIPHVEAISCARLEAEFRMLCGEMGGNTPLYLREMTAALGQRAPVLTEGKEGEVFPGRPTLWKYGISGDRPLFFHRVEDPTELRARLWAWKYLLLCGVRSDLILAVRETDRYLRPAETLVRRIVKRAGLSFYLGEGGYLHIVSEADAAADGLPLLCAAGRDALPVFSRDPVPPPRREGLPRCHVTEEAVYIEKGDGCPPWSHMLTNRTFGTLLTTETLGFTFFENARECRVTPWYPAYLQPRGGEQLLLQTETRGPWYDLCRHAAQVTFYPEKAEYEGHVGDVAFLLSVSVPDRRRRKRLRLCLRNEGETRADCTVSYRVEPLMGVLPEDGGVIRCRCDGPGVTFQRNEGGCAAYIASVRFTGTDAGFSGVEERHVYAACRMSIEGGASAVRDACLSVHRREERPCPVSLPAVLPYHDHRVSPTGIPYLDPLLRTWLPHQIMGVRLWGRCGQYQPGGAYGFRDQLQDAMAAAYLEPSLLKAQILRCAAHQYLEGDVQHWWHPGPTRDPAKFHRGIRSRCSDDLLWLPLALARYVEMTGDTSLCNTPVRYLESAVLAPTEGERYEEPLRSNVKESVYMHCVRALEHSFSFGVHGLPLMGTGDWNDGMNEMGRLGSGETVWGGMFLLLVLDRFRTLCKGEGDPDGYRIYGETMRHLANAVEECYNGQWYLRALYDDGTPMGRRGDDCAEIDLLPQAFGALIHHTVTLPDGSKPLSGEHVRSAMLSAYDRLFDEERGVFALLSPPFVRGEGRPDPGYIAGYIPGVRENGGQYTHAAVWGCMALFAIGEEEKALRVLRSLSPLWLTRDDEGLARYQKEPWALCGDILMARGREGEGGWSQYTGSAGWYYRLLREVFR